VFAGGAEDLPPPGAGRAPGRSRRAHPRLADCEVVVGAVDVDAVKTVVDVTVDVTTSPETVPRASSGSESAPGLSVGRRHT